MLATFVPGLANTCADGCASSRANSRPTKAGREANQREARGNAPSACDDSRRCAVVVASLLAWISRFSASFRRSTWLNLNACSSGRRIQTQGACDDGQYFGRQLGAQWTEAAYFGLISTRATMSRLCSRAYQWKCHVVCGASRGAQLFW